MIFVVAKLLISLRLMGCVEFILTEVLSPEMNTILQLDCLMLL